MLHSNIGEVHRLLSTCNRVWGAGGEASLSPKTVDGKVKAVLEVQLGPPVSPRPGAPEACQQAARGVPQRHRGPGRQARDAARQDAWRRRRLDSQQPRQPPPLPAVASPAGDIALSPVKSPEKQNDPGPPGRRPFKCEMQLLLRHQAQSERA